jgi:type IV secretion system protein TrbE
MVRHRDRPRLPDACGHPARAEALGDAETLTYLHGTISNKRHPVAVPAIPTHVDAVVRYTPFLGGVEPKLGTEHLRVLTVLGFPNGTTPGLLDTLNDLGFAYHWVTRWISLDKTEATRHLTRLRRQWSPSACRSRPSCAR